MALNPRLDCSGSLAPATLVFVTPCRVPCKDVLLPPVSAHPHTEGTRRIAFRSLSPRGSEYGGGKA
jgi:hypothetical protein